MDARMAPWCGEIVSATGPVADKGSVIEPRLIPHGA
jgi:hypothetical protein